MFCSIFPKVVTSANRGTFEMVCSPSHRRAAARMGSAAFFAPLIATSPHSLTPPLMTIVFITLSAYEPTPIACFYHPVYSCQVLQYFERTVLSVFFQAVHKRLSLPYPHLHDEQSPALQIAGCRVDDLLMDLRALLPCEERQSRLVIPDLRLERAGIARTYVGRIRDNDINLTVNVK